MNKLRLLFSFVLFLVMFGLTKELAYGSFVNPLQQKVDEAKSGETIHIANGVYEGDLKINKSITLVGGKGVVIKGSGTQSVITINAPNVTLKNMAIEQSGKRLEKDDAGIKLNSNGNKLENLSIKNVLHGIYLLQSDHNQISNCTITGFSGLERSSKGNGIHLFHSSHNVITGNRIYDTRDGIYFSFSDHTKVEKNHVYNTRYGLHYMYSNFNQFYGNTFDHNIGGAAIMNSNHITLIKNKFLNNQSIRSFGVLFQTSDDITMKNNTLTLNEKGIFMDQSNRNKIIGNNLSFNSIGLEVWESSIDNLFTKNQIYKNNLQFVSDAGHDRNMWDLNGIGNAWSDQLFLDLDGNGISDAPYKSQTTMGDILSQNQLGVLFLHSSALKIYDTMSHFFTNGTWQVKDNYPIAVDRGKTAVWTSILSIMAVLFIVFILRRLMKT